MSHEEERAQEGSIHISVRASMIRALRFAGNYPKPVQGVPAEIFVRNLFAKYAQPEDVMRDVGEGRVSQTLLVVIDGLRS